MLLALFLISLAAGLYVFLPLVGRRNAGVKFYRLVMMISAVLASCAAAAHWLSRRGDLAFTDCVPILLTAAMWLVLRYPKRAVYWIASTAVGVTYVGTAVIAYQEAVAPRHWIWTLAGVLTTIALLGSVNLAMTLGHWYLVVRGMPIEPLKRLTIAIIIAAAAKILVVSLALTAGNVLQDVMVRHGIFFWMRAAWGLLGPVVLFPMIWGTVRIRSTMAATGILYVAVVAVVIGEVLGGWLSALVHLPV
jgi:hypothetical protein